MVISEGRIDWVTEAESEKRRKKFYSKGRLARPLWSKWDKSLQKHPDLYSASSGVHIKEISIKYYSVFFYFIAVSSSISLEWTHQSLLTLQYILDIVVWMRMASIESYIWTLCSQLVELFVKSRRYGLVREYISLGVGFAVSKDSCRSLCSFYLLVVDQDVSFLLFLCWFILNSNPLKPKAN